MSTHNAIGIDLGTANSCVAVVVNGKVEVIPNDHGNRTTPSYVAFTETGRLIGDDAKNQLIRNAENTIFYSQRIIGRTDKDSTIPFDSKHWPFRVISGKNSSLKLVAEYMHESKVFAPEEISAMVLEKMKKSAEAYLGAPVQNAVITVPAYFNDAKRQATKDAATIAGLNVLRIINAPSAASMAHSFKNKINAERLILVFDLGAGHISISIMKYESGITEVVFTVGASHHGGEVFDQRLMKHFAGEFHLKYGVDLSSNPTALCRLRTACESAKRTLSSSTEATLEINSIFGGKDLNATITRACFESLCGDLFISIMELVSKCLREAKIVNNQIDDIVLTGGSSRIPMIQTLLSAFFLGKELNKSVNPDEAVACGAAIQAAVLSGDRSQLTKDVLLLDVATHSLGVETDEGVMTCLIKRNTTTPTRTSHEFSTFFNNRPNINIKVYEGESALCKDNQLLGEFVLVAPKLGHNGVPRVEVIFDIGADGILRVSAVDKHTGHQNQITINSTSLSQQEITRMIKDAEKYRKDEVAQKKRIEAKDALETYIFNLKQTITDGKFNSNVSLSGRNKLMGKCEAVLRWLDENQTAKKDEYENQQVELERMITATIVEFSVAKEQQEMQRLTLDNEQRLKQRKNEKVKSLESDVLKLKNMFNEKCGESLKHLNGNATVELEDLEQDHANVKNLVKQSTSVLTKLLERFQK